MDAIAAVLAKLDDQSNRLAQIEKALVKIAVQDEKIINLQTQVSTLFRKLDEVCGPEGTIVHIKQHQAGCPKPQVKWLWGAIGSMALMIIGKFLADKI
jgi:small-conductance mechanosensitive channel